MRAIDRRKALLVSFAILNSIHLPRLAWANGDEFFRFDAFKSGSIENQTVFVGSVKDESGQYISNATITVTVTVPTEQGDKPVSYNAYTDILGRYRSLDATSVVLVLEEIEIAVTPEMVDVTVEKPGYTMIRRLRRGKASQKKGAIEIDFTMAKAKEKAAAAP